jgi:formylglycine-generating enzyme required for sulfatase activity
MNKTFMILPVSALVIVLCAGSETTTDYREMATIPGGTTTLQGRSVTLTGFKIGKYEVTYSYWREIYLWAVQHGYKFEENQDTTVAVGLRGTCIDGSDNLSGNEPVADISWCQAIVWCNALSQKKGLIACYTYNKKAINDATSCDNAVLTLNANGYRLPTEAEWEYASRYQDGKNWTPENFLAGASADYTNNEACNEVAVFSDNSDRTGNGLQCTDSVGNRKATMMGLHDMSGNVCEWCWDWYGAINKSPVTDPTGPVNGPYRMLRGGDWESDLRECQVSYREYNPKYVKSPGFRIVKR